MSDKNVNIFELAMIVKRIAGGSRLFNLYDFISFINFVLLLTQINLTIRTITIRHNIIRNMCIDIKVELRIIIRLVALSARVH